MVLWADNTYIFFFLSDTTEEYLQAIQVKLVTTRSLVKLQYIFLTKFHKYCLNANYDKIGFEKKKGCHNCVYCVMFVSCHNQLKL